MHVLEQVSLNQFLSERWVEHWSDILGNSELRRHLPQMLNCLGKTIKSKRYLDKMESLTNVNKGNSREISDLLDSSIKNAIYNVKWINNIKQEI